MIAKIQAGNRPGFAALLLVIAIVIFVLGVAGVHVSSLKAERITDLGLVFVAGALLL